MSVTPPNHDMLPSPYIDIGNGGNGAEGKIHCIGAAVSNNWRYSVRHDE